MLLQLSEVAWCRQPARVPASLQAAICSAQPPSWPLQCLEWLDFPPAALASLTALRILFLRPPRGALALQQLPPGPWLHSLRMLKVPASLAAASLPALSAATQLRRLQVWEAAETELSALFGWAVVHGPSLQQLLVYARAEPSPAARAALLNLRRRRPDLEVWM